MKKSYVFVSMDVFFLKWRIVNMVENFKVRVRFLVFNNKFLIRLLLLIFGK